MPVEDRWFAKGADGAKIERPRHGQGKRWRAYYRAPDSRQRSASFTRKLDADRWLEGQATDRNAGAWIAPERGRVTMSQMWDAWLPTKRLKPSTDDTYRHLWRKHIEPAFGSTAVADLTYGAVTAWVARLTSQGKMLPDGTRGPLSASRVRQALNVLSMVLEHAVKDQRISRNPAASVDLPRMPKNPRQRFLTVEQLHALADACAAHARTDDGGELYKTVVLFLGTTGLRWGEMAALRVGDVDPLRRRITVNFAAIEVAGRIETGPPKSGASREVPMPTLLRDPYVNLAAGKARGDIVFQAPVGNPQKHADFRRRVFPLAAADIGEPDMVPHELRHTAASLAIASGANIKMIQRMLGHTSAAMTLDLYGHLYDDEFDALTRALDAHLAAPQTAAVKGVQ